MFMRAVHPGEVLIGEGLPSCRRRPRLEPRRGGKTTAGVSPDEVRISTGVADRLLQ